MVIISKYSNTIEYKLKTTLDASGLTKLQSELNNLSLDMQKLANRELISDKNKQSTLHTIDTVQKALTQAFNPKLGMLDINKFQKGLEGLPLSRIQKEFYQMGSSGKAAFVDLLGSLGKLDVGLKSTSSNLDKIKNTIGNTIRWGVISSAFNQVSNSISRSVDYMKELDDSLTQIMLVTDYSRENMNSFAKDANEAAKALGSTTVAMANASLVFAQQGFNLEQSSQLAELSTKLANASQQDTATTSDQITAYMNAYGLDKNMAALQGAMDAWAEVANVSAADVAELATASQKAASTANTVGVSMDQLNGQIAAIESVTREAPEQIGNGLKTLYARFSDLQSGETLEDGVSLGKVTSQLEKYGVEVLNGEGQMRGVGDIMEDLMEVWSSIDTTQKAAIAQTVAGKYQLGRFEALMNRSDLYTQYKDASQNAEGTLDEMNQEYVNSLEGKLNQLQVSLEGVFSSLFETDDFYGMIDALSEMVTLMDNFVQSIGGGGQALLALGNIGLKVFSKDIGANLARTFYNNKTNKLQQEQVSSQRRQVLNLMGLGDIDEAEIEDVVKFIDNSLTRSSSMTKEQLTQNKQLLDEQVQTTKAQIEAQEQLERAVFATSAAYNMLGVPDVITENKDGSYDYQGLEAQVMGRTTLTPAEIKGLDWDNLINQLGAAQRRAEELHLVIQTLFKSGADPAYSEAFYNNLERMETAFAKLEAETEDLPGPIAEVKKEFQELFKTAVLDNDFSLEDISAKLDEIRKKLLMMYDSATETQKNGIDIVDTTELQKRQQNAADKQSMTDLMRKKSDTYFDELDMSIRISSATEMISALGDLSFAWTSFQQLGSLWTNDDLTFGEKLVQTVTNLAFTLPQLTTALKILNLPSIKKEVGKAATDLLDVAQGTGMVAKGAKVAGTAMAKFDAVLGALIPHGHALKLALGVAAAALTVFGITSQQEKNRVETLAKSAEEASAKLQNISQNKADFNSVYEKYKKGQASSTELENAAKVLNDTLNDQSLVVQSLAGNWEAYSQNVDAAAKKEAQAQQNILKQSSWEAERSYATKASNWDTLVGPKNNDLSAKMRMNNSVANIYLNQNAISRDLLGNWGVMDNSTAVDRIQALNDINDAYVEAIANAAGKQKEVLQEEYDGFTSFAGKFAEEKAAVETAWNAEAQGALAAFGDEEDFQLQSNETLEQYKQRLLETGKFSSEGAVEAFVEGMASGDFSSSEAIALQAGQEKTEQVATANFTNKISNSLAAQSDDPNSLYQTLENAGVDTTQYRDQISNVLTQTILKQVSESGLSPEDQQTLLNNIDWSQSIEDILANLTKSINNNTTETGNAVEFGSADRERHSDLINTYNIDEGTIETYRELQEEITALGDAQDELAQKSSKAAAKAEEIKKSEGENSQAYKDAARDAKKAKKTLDAYNDTQEDLVELSLQSQKGMESLIKSFEKNAKIIKSGNKNTLEYAEAIDETREAVADLVNTSKEHITPEFITDNLDDIEKAVNGDTDAIGRLRAAAANQILLEISKTGNLTEEELTLLQNKALELSSMTIEPYAQLDDENFIAALNNMLKSGKMTAAQVQSYLNAVGYDPVIDTESTKYKAFSIPETKVPIELFDHEVGGINIPSIEVSGYSEVPVIKSIQSSGGGGDYSPARSVAKSPSRSGGGGGGKGGGGKAYQPKENKDPIDKVIDRYEKVATVLGSVSADYEKLNDEQDRLTGDKLAENLQKQNELLLRQIELYKEKLEIQQQEVDEVKNKLSSQFGVGFDAEGFMTNYAQVHQQLIDEVNRLGNQYAGLGSEEAEKALDKQYEAAQKRLDTFEKLYQRYDELLSSDLKDTIQQIEDLQDAIEDMRIEIFKTSIEALDNIREIRQELAEFTQSQKIWFNEDPFAKAKESVLQLGEFWDGAIENVDKYYDELIAKEQEAANKASTEEGKLYHNNRILQLQNAKNNQGKESLDYVGTGFFDMQFSNVLDMLKEMEEFEKTGSSTTFGKNSAAMYETALDVLKQANSTLNDYKDKVLELRDVINDMVDEILEKEEERQKLYENINDELEHQIDLITMIHGEEAYDQLKQAYDAQLTNTKNQIAEMNQTLAANKELLAQMEAAGDTSSDAYKALKDNIADAQKELNGLVQSSIENIRKQQELTVKSITDSWVKNALGTDLDWMQTEWELINRNADYYLDDVNKAYNIQKLQGKYLELLDQSNDVGIQSQITAQMKEQLKYLREKKNLSEYDVQYANAQLEILQKRIALEEAQRNKSQMKLRRDSQGNYSYVYTANEGDVANAQSGLLDAQNNAYNLSKEQMKQTQADSLSALADAKSLIDSIWTNANLSLEEKKKRTEAIIGSLKEYLAATSEQLGVSEQNIINDFLGMCEALTDENKTGLQETYEEIVNGNKDAFDKIDDRWSTSLTGWLESLDKFNQDTTDKFDSLYGEMEDYESQIDEIGDLVGQNFDDMTGSIQGTLDKTEELRNSTQGFISDLQKMSGAVADAEKSMAYYRDKITEANNEMSMYQQKVNELGSKLEQAEREKADMRAEIQQMQDAEAARQQAANGGGSGAGSGSSGGASGQANSATAWGIAQAIWTYGGKSGWGNDPTRSTKLKKAYGDAFAREVQNIINQNARSGKLVNYDSMKYSSYNLIGYDTGGYTGNWNDNTFDDKNGKLAILHQKELILNATDTQNILATVSAVRDLVSGLKTQALNGLSTMFAVGNIAQKEAAQDINQNVHITAEFPSVSSSSEIESALLNLNERAIQYAFKNN